jgi:hypothetical protein
VKVTGAYFEFVVNTKGATIIAKNLLSPGAAVLDTATWGRRADPEELPEVRHASEFYWGYWFHDKSNVRDLRVYRAHSIVNDAAVLLVA